MSYPDVWGVDYEELRASGFRPLTASAWAGISHYDGLAAIKKKATRKKIPYMVAVTRGEMNARFRYTFDMTFVVGQEYGFIWSVVPFPDLGRFGTRPWQQLSPNCRAGFAFFSNEADAVAWKLSI